MRTISRFRDYKLPEVRVVHQFFPECDDFISMSDFHKRKSTLPIQEGDVVQVPRWSRKEGRDVPTEALIIGIWLNRRLTADDYILKFRIVMKTAKGEWAKSWTYAYPGPIQRALAQVYPMNPGNAYILKTYPDIKPQFSA